MVHFESDNHSAQVLVQQAETVRFINEEGNISVTSLEKGDKIAVRLSSGMRHIGREITGEMNEK